MHVVESIETTAFTTTQKKKLQLPIFVCHRSLEFRSSDSSLHTDSSALHYVCVCLDDGNYARNINSHEIINAKREKKERIAHKPLKCIMK